MKKRVPAGNRGLIRTILLIIIALLIVSYFGINLRTLVSSPTTQDNISYVASTSVTVWDNYLKVPVTYLWKEVFVELVWKPALGAISNSGGFRIPDLNSMPTGSSTPRI